MDSSLQLINVTAGCAILAGDSHTDPLLRGKTWGDPAVRRRAKVVARLEELCRSGKPFTAGFGSHCIHRSESPPAFILPQGRDFPFSSVCSSISSIPHIQLARGVLHSQDIPKLNHHARISTQPKLLHMLKIYKGRQRVKRSLFLNEPQKRFWYLSSLCCSMDNCSRW